jgi:hypothetical protein
MRRPVAIIVLLVLMMIIAWSFSTVHLVRVQQYCNNAVQWRVTFWPPNEHNLSLGPGLYSATSYSLSNQFGYRGVAPTFFSIPASSGK